MRLIEVGFDAVFDSNVAVIDCTKEEAFLLGTFLNKEVAIVSDIPSLAHPDVEVKTHQLGTVQLVLFMETEYASGPSMRTRVLRLSCEDPRLVAPGPIEDSPYLKAHVTPYDSVLRALAHGWKLLAPPMVVDGRWIDPPGMRGQPTCQWTLVKEVPRG